jgi:4-hydroxybenzoate polyprenyltransferase
MQTDDSMPSPRRAKLLAYLQLFRLPNVFTAVADVAMGFLITHDMQETAPTPRLVGAFALIVLASMLLYTAGMVLNDVFDAHVDARERPERPIPSGRVSWNAARLLGLEMLLLGVALGFVASFLVGDPRPGALASALAASVLLYDTWAKKTALGPFAMGGCRFFNALLGMSLAGFAWDAGNWMVAGGVGIYIAGVTWFARTEDRDSSRLHLALATLVMGLGFFFLGWFPAWTNRITPPPNSWLFFWAVLALLIGWRCLRAIAAPSPAHVQTAVKQSILSLIILDAAVAYAAQGPQGIVWVLAVLALLLPTLFLGKWIYST